MRTDNNHDTCSTASPPGGLSELDARPASDVPVGLMPCSKLGAASGISRPRRT